MAACVVLVVRPGSDPAASPALLALLALALASRRSVLLCADADAGGAGGASGSDAAAAATAERWRGAVDAMCAREGLDAGSFSAVVAHVGAGGGEGRREGRAAAGAEAGAEASAEAPQAGRDVEAWVRREAAAYDRAV